MTGEDGRAGEGIEYGDGKEGIGRKW